MLYKQNQHPIGYRSQGFLQKACCSHTKPSDMGALFSSEATAYADIYLFAKETPPNRIAERNIFKRNHARESTVNCTKTRQVNQKFVDTFHVFTYRNDHEYASLQQLSQLAP